MRMLSSSLVALTLLVGAAASVDAQTPATAPIAPAPEVFFRAPADGATLPVR